MGTISFVGKPKQMKPVGIISLVKEIGPANCQVKGWVDSDTVGIINFVVTYTSNIMCVQ
jgi:hypothetical protein